MKIYLYGMICASSCFKLSEFPKPDEYTEIEQSARFIGGESLLWNRVYAVYGRRNGHLRDSSFLTRRIC